MSIKYVLVSSMYPSDDNPRYGVFVRNIELLLEQNGVKAIKKIVITYKESAGTVRGYSKLVRYLLFYLQLIIAVFKHKDKIFYIHFPTTTLPVIKLLSTFSIKRKYILNFHGSDILTADKKRINVLKGMSSECLLYITPSMFLKQVVTEKLGLLKHEVFVSPSGGVNLELFKPENNKEIKYDFIYVSRIHDLKGWAVALSAFQKLVKSNRHIKMLFVGSGTHENKLFQKLKSVQNVDWSPALSQQQLAEIYKQGRWLVFPSKYDESLALVPLEAMASGTPVISTNLGAPKFYIKDSENGLCGEPNTDSFYLMMKKAIAISSSQYLMMRIEAIKTATDYCSKTVGKLLAEEFKKVV